MVRVWLTLFPCRAALIQAAYGFPNPWQLIIFSFGAFLMRSAGSIANDIADRNFDGHVERNRFRPLASGQIGPLQAFVFLGVQLWLAASLLLFLPSYTRAIAICVLPLVFIYPLCKRFTQWQQAVQGAAFNWGMLMVWAEGSRVYPAWCCASVGRAMANRLQYNLCLR